MTRKFRARHFILAAVGVLMVAIIVVAVASVLMVRERETESWRGQVDNLSLVMAEQTSQAMLSAQIAMESIADRIDALGITNEAELRSLTKTEVMHQVLRDKITGLTQVDVATIVAANGDLLNFTRSFPVPAINLSDRDYFEAQRDTPALGLYISKPVRNKGNGEWVFYLSRRLNGSSGQFIGLVLIGISVDQFIHFYERLGKNLGDGAAITLYRRDFTVLARWPDKDGSVGENNLAGTSRRLVEHLKKNNDDAYTSGLRSSASGASPARLSALRVLERFPMIVSLTVADEFLLASWLPAAQWIASVAVGSLVTLVIATIVLLRIARQREQSAALLRGLADQVPGMLFQRRLSPDGRVFFPYVNQSGLKMHRLRSEQLPVDEAAIFSCIHPEDMDRVRESLGASARKLQPWHDDYRLLLPDNGVVWRHGDAQPQKLKDGTTLWHGYISDISESKHLEETLRKSEEMLSHAELASKSGNWDIHIDTQLVIASKGAARVYGLSEGHNQLSVVQKAALPEYRPLLDSAMRDLIERNAPYDVVFKIRTVDTGEIKDIRSMASFDPEKRVFFGVIQDISASKQAEMALQESEARFRAIIEASPIPYALNDEQLNVTYLNVSFIKTFGYALDDIPHLSDWWPKAYPDPEYRQRLVATWQEHMEIAERENQPFEPVEAEICCKNGERRTVLVAAEPLNASLHGLHVVSFFDISARKRAEEEQRLAATVFSHAREGILISDANGIILDVNEMFSQLTGFRREEVVGNPTHLLSSGRHGKNFYAALWRELIANGHWTGEIWNRRKNGEIYPAMLTISAVRDPQGKTLQYVALFSDITVSKDHERQLEHMAHHDVLTRLPNRALLADRLQQAMSQSARRKQGVAMCYIDLDGFKAVNDTHGHEVGDQLLIALAAMMRQVLRECDTLARIGGDEFVAVLLDQTDEDSSLLTVERLIQTISQPVHLGEIVVQVSASIGVTFYPRTETVDGDQLLRQADYAMYQAKSAGKNRYCIFRKELDANPAA